MCVCGEVEAESEGGSGSETGGKSGSEGGGQRVCHLSRHQRTNPPQKPRRVVAAPCALRCRRRHRRTRAAAAAAALGAHRAQGERARPRTAAARARAVPLCEADCEVRVVRATHLELRIGPRWSRAVGSATLGAEAPQPQPLLGTQAARAIYVIYVCIHIYMHMLFSGLEGRPEQAGGLLERRLAARAELRARARLAVLADGHSGWCGGPPRGASSQQQCSCTAPGCAGSEARVDRSHAPPPAPAPAPAPALAPALAPTAHESQPQLCALDLGVAGRLAASGAAAAGGGRRQRLKRSKMLGRSSSFTQPPPRPPPGPPPGAQSACSAPAVHAVHVQCIYAVAPARPCRPGSRVF